MKVNIDGEKFKGFFLQHGEKLAVGIAVLLLVFFGYQAIDAHVLGPEKSPEKLKSDAEAAKQHIQAAGYQSDATTMVNGAAVAPPGFVALINNPVFKKMGKRGEPQTIPPVDLHVAAGAGAIAMAAPNGAAAGARPGGLRVVAPQPGQVVMPGGIGAKGQPGFASNNGPVEARHWVAVTAAVEIKRQLDLFNKVLGEASLKDTATDTPNYRWLYVQRIELPSENAPIRFPENADNRASINAVPALVREERAKLAGESASVIDPELTSPALTAPLPPLLLKDFAIEDIADPKIIVLQQQREAAKNIQAPAAPAAAEPGAGEEPFGASDPKAAKAAPRAVVSQRANATAEKQAPEMLLARYFDFNVQPGKTYAYRMRLVMTNPNYGKEEQHLLVLKSKIEPFLFSAWSEPSAPVTIPYDTRILANKVTPAPRFDKEASAKYAIDSFDTRSAIEAVKEFDAQPLGSLANHEATVDAADPASGQVKSQERFPFKSNCLLIDFRGGEPIVPVVGRSNRGAEHHLEPSEMLFIDLHRGELITHDEIDDRDELNNKMARSELNATGGNPTGPAPALGLTPPTPTANGASNLETFSKPRTTPKKKR